MDQATALRWSPQQVDALVQAQAWLAAKDRQVFKLFGYAGTGKTTLARHLAEGVAGEVFFGAYTGKAALVLRQRGCPGATTLHRLMYQPQDKSRDRLRDLEQQLVEAQTVEAPATPDKELTAKLELMIREEKAHLKRPAFSIHPEAPLKYASLIVVDEVSMVGEKMALDLLSFERPVLVLGDEAQLPPVGDGGYFTRGTPDVLLQEVHRQAKDSPIIELATRVRHGERLPLGTYGTSRVVPRGLLKIRDAKEHDQVLVGRNATRTKVNKLYRAIVMEVKSPLPVVGDKLVCLRNDHEMGLLNGSTWKVAESRIVDDDYLFLTVADNDGTTIECLAHRAPFEGRELDWWQRLDAQEFDYGYALTVHKAQGSQWPRVLLVDESAVFRQDARRWLYTGLTRAAEQVTVVTD